MLCSPIGEVNRGIRSLHISGRCCAQNGIQQRGRITGRSWEEVLDQTEYGGRAYSGTRPPPKPASMESSTGAARAARSIKSLATGPRRSVLHSRLIMGGFCSRFVILDGHPFVQCFGVRFVRDWMGRVGGEKKLMMVLVLPFWGLYL